MKWKVLREFNCFSLLLSITLLILVHSCRRPRRADQASAAEAKREHVKLERDTLINKKIEEGGKEVLKNLFNSNKKLQKWWQLSQRVELLSDVLPYSVSDWVRRQLEVLQAVAGIRQGLQILQEWLRVPHPVEVLFRASVLLPIHQGPHPQRLLSVHERGQLRGADDHRQGNFLRGLILHRLTSRVQDVRLIFFCRCC